MPKNTTRQTTIDKHERHPLVGTSYIEFPLETHQFITDPLDDYRCQTCKRPRALHLNAEQPRLRNTSTVV